MKKIVVGWELVNPILLAMMPCPHTFPAKTKEEQEDKEWMAKAMIRH
jgi:hypothetical protein